MRETDYEPLRCPECGSQAFWEEQNAEVEIYPDGAVEETDRAWSGEFRCSGCGRRYVLLDDGQLHPANKKGVGEMDRERLMELLENETKYSVVFTIERCLMGLGTEFAREGLDLVLGCAVGGIVASYETMGEELGILERGREASLKVWEDLKQRWMTDEEFMEVLSLIPRSRAYEKLYNESGGFLDQNLGEEV